MRPIPAPFRKVAKKKARKAYNDGLALGLALGYLVTALCFLLWPSRSEQ